MKKIYINPVEKIINLDAEAMIAFSTQNDTPAQGDGYVPEGGGNGNNDSRTTNLWDQEW